MGSDFEGKKSRLEQSLQTLNLPPKGQQVPNAVALIISVGNDTAHRRAHISLSLPPQSLFKYTTASCSLAQDQGYMSFHAK
jgi:hypothetical protein